MENNTERDKFAKSIGVQVIEALPERAVCKLEINENHLNGLGLVNGGVLFTIGDLAMAVAANANGSSTVTLNSSIDFKVLFKSKLYKSAIRSTNKIFFKL